MKTDTPETDAALWHNRHQYHEHETRYVEADFARKLERQRDALLSALEEARVQMTNFRYNKPRIGMEDACARADKAIAAVKGEQG